MPIYNINSGPRGYLQGALPWRSQPQYPVAPAPYALARGLKSLILPSVRWDMVAGPITQVGAGVFRPTEKGRSYFLQSQVTGTQRLDVNATAFSQPTAWTVIALVRSTYGSLLQYIANVNWNGSTVPMALCIGGRGAMDGASFYNGSWAGSGKTTDIRGDNKWHVVAGTAGPSGILCYYIDGVLDKSAAGTPSFGSANANPLTWANYLDDIAPFQGDFALGAAFNTELSAAEVKDYSDNPWQLFEAAP